MSKTIESLVLNQKTYTNVKLLWGRYADGSRALVLANDEGTLTVVTTALDGYVPDLGTIFVKTWSENTGLLEALENTGALRRTDVVINTGHDCKVVEAEILDPYYPEN